VRARDAGVDDENRRPFDELSRTCPALGDFRSSAIPRLLRLARAGVDHRHRLRGGGRGRGGGVGGMRRWFAIAIGHASAVHLMTSAPKSDKINGPGAGDEDRLIHHLSVRKDVVVRHVCS